MTTHDPSPGPRRCRPLRGSLAALALLAGLATATLADPAAAQVAAAADYPSRSLRYVVPFPPGGLTDAMARMVGQRLAESLKQPVVVENRPGGNALIGADVVAKSPADGYTLLAITLAHAANATLFPNAPYRFERDLTTVAVLASSPMLVVVPAGSTIRTMKDLEDAARARPLTAGSSGNGTPPHLTQALFSELTRVTMTHVPYKGGAPALTDLIGGQIDVIFSNFPESSPHVKSGKLRALAITSRQRHPAFPDVPTTAEAGYPDLVVENWTAMMVPAATPRPVVERLGAEAVAFVASREGSERVLAGGFTPMPIGPDKAQDFVMAETRRWGDIIRKAGIKAD